MSMDHRRPEKAVHSRSMSLRLFKHLCLAKTKRRVVFGDLGMVKQGDKPHHVTCQNLGIFLANLEYLIKCRSCRPGEKFYNSYKYMTVQLSSDEVFNSHPHIWRDKTADFWQTKQLLGWRNRSCILASVHQVRNR